jgi:predicted CXXCH cytochrome family protein
MFGSLLLIFLISFSSGRDVKTVSSEKRNDECISCHGELLKNKVVHPQLETTCDICHSSTGAEHPKKNVKGFNLSEKLPVLCFNCHSDFQEHMSAYSSVHGAVRDSVSCMNCHNPHSAPSKKLLLDNTNELCLKCHNKTIRNDSVRIKNIGQVLSKAKSIHSPIESGGCVACHNPHFSEKRSLLTGYFSSDQYVKAVPANFELCFRCHKKDLLQAESTEFGTNFRNSKRNLHFVHIKGDKGRNCTMCHDIHGAVNDKLIADRIKFGSWEIKISFIPTNNGGSCLTSCHTEKKYDRTIPKKPAPVVPQKKKK